MLEVTNLYDSVVLSTHCLELVINSAHVCILVVHYDERDEFQSMCSSFYSS